MINKENLPLIKDIRFLLATVALFGMLFFAYSGHFNNPFHFDDAHTIQNNLALRKLSNIPLFFKDATTTSSLPANQAYRPGLNTLNAIDFWMGGGSEPIPKYYHISIFSAYVLLGILLFFMIFKIFNQARQHWLNRWFALFATGLYMLHTANAETVNYIISRTDLYSTLFVVMAFVLYQYSAIAKRFYLYLIAVIFGLFVKEPAVMLGPLLVLYALLFQEKADLTQIFKTPAKLGKAFLAALPALLLGVVLFAFTRVMTPPTFTSGGLDRWHYLATETFVIVHYVNSFFLPFNLSADTDWTLITNYFDDRVVIGTFFVVALFVIGFLTSKQEKNRPISFGIFWFFIALAPTSSFMPWAEVLNDHRVFFPYIGLAISVVWAFGVFIIDNESRLETNMAAKVLAVAVPLVLLSAHTIGTRNRCKVWSSSESLWKDVVDKSPNNARGLMNYGNALMAKADYANALVCFEKAKTLWPQYSYVYINIGVLKAATNQPAEAESNYKYAIQLNPNNPETFFYYGSFLIQKGRYGEAQNVLSQGLAISPNHLGLNGLKAGLNNLPSGAATTKLELALTQAKEKPTPETWLNASLEYYLAGDYQGCVTAAEKVLEFKPNNDMKCKAYNNICSAYNILKEWDKGIEAGKKAVDADPASVLAKNNLAVSVKGKAGI